MKPGPTARLVDDAATLCSMVASNRRFDLGPPVSDSLAALGISGDAYALARKAVRHSIDALLATEGYAYSLRDAWAQAEAMLRTREVRP